MRRNLDAVLVGLSFTGCEPVKAGPAYWRSTCPACGERDALGLGVGLGGLSVAARCGCARATILQALGVEVEP